MHRLAAILLASAMATSAIAQGVNSVPQMGTISSISKRQTFAAASIGLVPAASATDFFCISNSSSKNIHVTRINVSGTAGTLVTAPITLVHRQTLDSGGTAATGTAAPTATPMAFTNASATATLTAYTANPTVNDTSPGYYRSAYLTLPTTAAGTGIFPIEWHFSTYEDQFDQGLDLIKGITGQYCLNLNTVSITSGSLHVDIEWSED